jgi:Tfp pilus assembly protein FimT
MNLPEMLVTFSIVSIVSVSGVSFMGNVSAKRMEAASLRLYAMMQTAKSIAITQNKYAGIYIEEKEGKHIFTIVTDGNYNGLRTKDIEKGIDAKTKIHFCLEKDYKGVEIEKISFLGKKFISFSPYFKSSTGSIIFKTKTKQDGKVKIKLYGLTTLMRPVRIFADKSEKEL